MHRPTLRQVLASLDRLYDPGWAADWDAVGLVCGDPDADVARVLFAVDPVSAVVDEAISWGADLLLTHHPLLLRPVHGVAATTPKGRLIHRLIRSGVALHVCHTNADHANPGVSDALAAALGLRDLRLLDADSADPLDKVVTYVPVAEADKVIDALAGAGAGRLGDYDRCAFTAAGVGTFRPRPGAQPMVGTVGEIARVDETRIEMVLPRHRRTAVLRALQEAHPYEEPAYDLLEMADLPGDRGRGRVGVVAEPTTLRRFAERVASALPATATGVRAAGDADQRVETVAVCAGAGDGLLEQVRASGADVYLTSDLRHHPASQFREHDTGTALVDVAHWAAEWMWLAQAADRLADALQAARTTVDIRVSRANTDPWTFHVPQRGAS